MGEGEGWTLREMLKGVGAQGPLFWELLEIYGAQDLGLPRDDAQSHGVILGPHGLGTWAGPAQQAFSRPLSSPSAAACFLAATIRCQHFILGSCSDTYIFCPCTLPLQIWILSPGLCL